MNMRHILKPGTNRNGTKPPEQPKRNDDRNNPNKTDGNRFTCKIVKDVVLVNIKNII
jgi:hypothetical protein